MGNLAAAPQPVRPPGDTTAGTRTPVLGPQRTLFPSKVIPFDQFAAPPRPTPRPSTSPEHPPQPKPRRQPAARKSDAQSELDFLPASSAPKMLKTTVEAVIFCDAPVATLTHRALAGSIDFSLMLVGFGMCLATYAIAGGGFPDSHLGYLMFGGAFTAIALFYGLLWTLVHSETPGMRWTGLHLTNFDGFTPDPGQRALRYLATCLSIAAFGLGLMWALVDEENLTWQDHISKTFPTFRHRSE